MKKFQWLVVHVIVMAFDAALNGGVFWLLWHFRHSLWDLNHTEARINAALSLGIWPTMFLYHEVFYWLTDEIPSLRESLSFGLIKKPEE